MFFSTYPLHRVLAHLWRCGIINDFRKILHAETPPEAIRESHDPQHFHYDSVLVHQLPFEAWSVSERYRHDRVIEKIIHRAGGSWRRKARHGRGAGAVDVAEPGARQEHAEAGGENNVVVEQRAELEAEAAIKPHLGADFVREQLGLDGVGLGEVDVIHVEKGAQFRRHIEVRAEAVDEDAGVDEVGLAFGFAAAEIGHKAVALFQTDGGAGKVEALARPVAEGAAGEVGIVDDGVEAGGGAVLGVAVAGSVEEGGLVTNPVLVVGEFERGHLGVDLDGASGEAVEVVVSENLIAGVVEVEPSMWPSPAQPR